MSTCTGNITAALFLLAGSGVLGFDSRAGLLAGDTRELVGVDTAPTDPT